MAKTATVRIQDDHRDAPPRVRPSKPESRALTRAGMSALLDLGMTNLEIARYFDINPRHVSMLRTAYGV